MKKDWHNFNPAVLLDQNNIGLLLCDCIIKETGRTGKDDDWCEFDFGCCRFQSSQGEKYLELIDLQKCGPLYSTKENGPIPLYEFYEGQFLINFLNGFEIIYPGTLFNCSDFSRQSMDLKTRVDVPFQQFMHVAFRNSNYYVKREHVEKSKVWFFTFPSTNKTYCFAILSCDRLSATFTSALDL